MGSKIVEKFKDNGIDYKVEINIVSKTNADIKYKFYVKRNIPFVTIWRKYKGNFNKSLDVSWYNYSDWEFEGYIKHAQSIWDSREKETKFERFNRIAKEGSVKRKLTEFLQK